MTITTTQQKPIPKSSKMTLAGVVRGKQDRPVRVVLTGIEGIGKTTFGANAPKPIFLGAEDGTGQLDVARFPMPESWTDVLEAVEALTVDRHDFETLVFDTLDWVEPMLWAHICKRDKQENIEAYGYGKGYAAALDEWRIFLAALERMRKTKPMHVILVAHTWIKPFKNPEGPDYDRYEMKLHPKAAGLLKEWSDCVLFANYETLTTKDDKTKRIKGVDSGARLLFTERRAAYDAKNRYGLPPVLPLDWSEFAAAVAAHAPADPKVLTAEILRKAELVGPKVLSESKAAIARINGDASKLAHLNNWVNSKVSKEAA